MQRLCAALHFGVGKLSSEVGREAGVAFDKTVVASLANAAFEKVRILWIGRMHGNKVQSFKNELSLGCENVK